MKLNPEGHRVVVKPDETKETSDGGIILVDETKDRENRAMTQGEFVAGGPMMDLAFRKDGEIYELTPGDRLLFVMYGGVIYEEDEVRYFVMNDEDILGIIK